MQNDTVERWLPVVGYEDWYEVSDLGRVRSVTRTVGTTHKKVWRGRLLTPTSWDGLYLNVALCRNGHKARPRIHLLVCAAFIGPRPDGTVIRHLDGDARNNRLPNLTYGPQSANIRDALRHGTHFPGSRTACARGHEYTDDNLRLRSRGTRVERICLQCERTRRSKRVSRSG